MSSPAHDEVFCTECGEVIKEEAEICPECGTPQESDNNTSSDTIDIPDVRRHELEKIANKDKLTVILLSIFITPLGYYWVGKTGLALLNFFTLNYLFLGPIIVPVHAHMIMESAKDELRAAGVEGY